MGPREGKRVAQGTRSLGAQVQVRSPPQASKWLPRWAPHSFISW